MTRCLLRPSEQSRAHTRGIPSDTSPPPEPLPASSPDNSLSHGILSGGRLGKRVRAIPLFSFKLSVSLTNLNKDSKSTDGLAGYLDSGKLWKRPKTWHWQNLKGDRIRVNGILNGLNYRAGLQAYVRPERVALRSSFIASSLPSLARRKSLIKILEAVAADRWISSGAFLTADD